MSLLTDQSDKPVGLASDHAGFEAKEYVKQILAEKDIPFEDFGTHSTESSDYADYGHPLAEAVEKGECVFGIAICGTGNGINMTVNKHAGIRGALCWNPEVTYYARAHNNANILSLPGRLLSKDELRVILDTFLKTPFEEGRHRRRIGKIPCG
ncbi:MAG TPA: ribose-5-phosphate isomerase [Porphyromonadaceae bacterium]|uniref:RpiB/LacA/LacB family sugar-phosphate isomerase n=1 Tax=Limibacterium fermenti TaxID=3229863 RepID=UPI000E9CBE3F|nr:ribose-5-phosphate isomerase [Porphyromonadaceae bacterium]HBK32650.1 ribose-5-phosphate isomerase [Porphyromonadaceae bacterium]HBL32802.1 ribose-5-phosphate isomerase [Porphyromonadaceae bacterium]HBX19027.1 ribose-5-phosphate isomerase [Porphyromonadaceae bacterium]HBX45265.1 ribose-5-phosphate isomerase [Porphyromonadaceae bacterium]